MNFFEYQHFYLVGIKGVAMTSLAQLLLDAGKTVQGSDVSEDFITQQVLERVRINQVDSFETTLPPDIDCVVYTAAHQGDQHPQVLQAKQRKIPIFSHAEALSFFLNQKHGIAVCGVGGKSTISAMITWILEQTGHAPSFSVGVGNIVGLNRTGQWRTDSQDFVAEADEYAANPVAVHQGAEIIPRFAYFKPSLIVCSHLAFDHPDVYKDEAHTLATFNSFFSQLKPNGVLIINQADRQKVTVTDKTVLSFGTAEDATVSYSFDPEHSTEGVTVGALRYQGTEYTLTLQIPGEYNIENAAAAILAAIQTGVDSEEAIAALASFSSTSRRFEKIGVWNGVTLYDDYAHHPSELAAVLKALKNWYPTKRCVVAFQPHTYSRTKSLFDGFVNSLAAAPELVLLDIFSSARESFDPSISSQLLADKISEQTGKTIPVLKDYVGLAEYCRQHLQPGDVLLTLGAGDIYKAHEQLVQGAV